MTKEEITKKEKVELKWLQSDQNIFISFEDNGEPRKITAEIGSIEHKDNVIIVEIKNPEPKLADISKAIYYYYLMIYDNNKKNDKKIVLMIHTGGIKEVVCQIKRLPDKNEKSSNAA